MAFTSCGGDKGGICQGNVGGAGGNQGEPQLARCRRYLGGAQVSTQVGGVLASDSPVGGIDPGALASQLHSQAAGHTQHRPASMDHLHEQYELGFTRSSRDEATFQCWMRFCIDRYVHAE